MGLVATGTDVHLKLFLLEAVCFLFQQIFPNDGCGATNILNFSKATMQKCFRAGGGDTWGLGLWGVCSSVLLRSDAAGSSDPSWGLAPLSWGGFRAGCWGVLQVLRRLPRPCFPRPFSRAAFLFQQNKWHPYRVMALKPVVRQTLNGDWSIGVASCSPSLKSCEGAKCLECSGECRVWHASKYISFLYKNMLLGMIWVLKL